MTDTYDAVFQAAYQKIARCDTSSVIESVARQAFDISMQVESVKQEMLRTLDEQQRPCVLFRPSIGIDGNQWCALYGDNLQDGVAGFGDSPSLAMHDFDRAWSTKHPRAGK